MRRVNPSWSWIFLATVLWTPPVVADSPARLHMKNQQVWDVVVHDRTSPQWVRVTKKGESLKLRLAPRDIDFMQFAVDLEKLGVAQHFETENYVAVAKRLGPALSTALAHLDVDNDIMPEVMTLIKCLTWSGAHEQARNTCDQVLELVKDEPFRSHALLFKSVVSLEQGNLEEARTLQAEALEPSGPEDETAGAYWYAKSRTLLADDDLSAAQEVAARLVAFKAKDVEWLPIGLYLSAEGYARAGALEVVDQIVEELNVVKPGGRWTREAANLRKQFTKDDEIKADDGTPPEAIENSDKEEKE